MLNEGLPVGKFCSWGICDQATLFPRASLMIQALSWRKFERAAHLLLTHKLYSPGT